MKKKYHLEVIRILAIFDGYVQPFCSIYVIFQSKWRRICNIVSVFHGMQRCGAFVFHGIRSTVAWKK